MDLGAVGGFEFQGRKYSRLPTEIVFSNDIDSDATNAYNANLKLFHHKHEAVLGDEREIKTSDIPNFDILLAGFPFSIACGSYSAHSRSSIEIAPAGQAGRQSPKPSQKSSRKR